VLNNNNNVRSSIRNIRFSAKYLELKYFIKSYLCCLKENNHNHSQ
jgi:hypothetical protein